MRIGIQVLEGGAAKWVWAEMTAKQAEAVMRAAEEPRAVCGECGGLPHRGECVGVWRENWQRGVAR